MLRPYLKIWEWECIFGRAMKTISSLGVRSPWIHALEQLNAKGTFDWDIKTYRNKLENVHMVQALRQRTRKRAL